MPSWGRPVRGSPRSCSWPAAWTRRPRAASSCPVSISARSTRPAGRHCGAGTSATCSRTSTSARALVGDRGLLLADEPTGALDSHTGEAVLALIRARCDAGAAGVLVTHEARHAAWADRCVFLRDGAIVDDTGAPSSVESLLEGTP